MTRSFGIYQANGKRKDGLKKAFVFIDTIDLNINKYILASDGSVWPIYYDIEQLKARQASKQQFKCIISFQVYNDGDYYAIARLYKDKE